MVVVGNYLQVGAVRWDGLARLTLSILYLPDSTAIGVQTNPKLDIQSVKLSYWMFQAKKVV